MQNKKNLTPNIDNYYLGYNPIKHGTLKICLKAKNLLFEGTNNFSSSNGSPCKESEDSSS